MVTCWACEAALDPAWKFCIRCGVSVSAGSATVASPAEPTSAYALFGWIMAALGAAILIIGVVLFLLT